MHKEIRIFHKNIISGFAACLHKTIDLNASDKDEPQILHVCDDIIFMSVYGLIMRRIFCRNRVVNGTATSLLNTRASMMRLITTHIG